MNDIDLKETINERNLQYLGHIIAIKLRTYLLPTQMYIYNYYYRTIHIEGIISDCLHSKLTKHSLGAVLFVIINLQKI